MDTVLEAEGGGGGGGGGEGESSLSDVDGSKQRKKRVFNSVSSVSRYSCRILCEREPPYTARLYAAAFDTNKKIQLSVRKGGREGEIHVITAGTTVLLVSYFSLCPLLYYILFFQAAAPTWSDSETGTTDALTTNGITLLRPKGVFESGVEPGEWREVTVMGNVRERRPLRSSRELGSPVSIL